VKLTLKDHRDPERCRCCGEFVYHGTEEEDENPPDTLGVWCECGKQALAEAELGRRVVVALIDCDVAQIAAQKPRGLSSRQWAEFVGDLLDAASSLGLLDEEAKP